jgi:hypothetical protein
VIKEEVIIHTENIQRLFQSAYFQIRLPKDTDRIIGIETGAIRKISGATSSGMEAYLNDYNNARHAGPGIDYDDLFTITKTETIGRLTLHSPASTDIFFQDEVRQQDISPKYADFSQYTELFNQWTHGRKRYETDVKVKNCSPVIEGHFTDSWGKFYNYHVIYQLNIYIWIEKN